jgi:PAS domain S-box-containing protein
MAENLEAGADLPFRQVAQHLPTPCWISDADGLIIWVNDAWLAYTGKDATLLAEEGLAVIHDPAILPLVRKKWTETKQAGEPSEMVFPLRGRAGEFRPFLTRVVPVRDTSGKVWRWFGTNTDVTREEEAVDRARRSELTLRENEARLRLATEASGVGIWEWRLDSNEMVYSPIARQICGFGEDGPVTYEMVVAATHPEDFPWTSAQAAQALDPMVRDHSRYEYRIVRPSGEIRWVTASGEAVFEADAKGELRATRYVGTLIDVTDHKLSDEAVRESERQLQLALRAGRMAPWRVDAMGLIWPSAEFNLLIGLPPNARPTMADLAGNYLPGELERIGAVALDALNSGDRYFEIEYRYRRADGEVRWFNTRAQAQASVDGKPDGLIGISMDITDRKADEERLQFLAREVDHRANNLMTIVESIVALSRGNSMEDLRTVLRGRIHALATTHQLLAQSHWGGAELRALVEEELSPYSLGETPPRVRMSGPEVVLNPASAQAVAMVFHELATNAAKYGALSQRDGSVEISWILEPIGTVRIRWMEVGGPPVRPPERRGFGTSVITRALQGVVSGKVELDWRREGLVADLLLPNP